MKKRTSVDYLTTGSMKASQILSLEAGTLIKGLHITTDGILRPDLDGWKFSEQSQKLNNDTYQLMYYSNSRVVEHLNFNRIIIQDPISIIDFKTITSNANFYLLDKNIWFNQEPVQLGDCIGMSLAETFIALQTGGDIYRPDTYNVFLFHKTLRGDKIKWLVLETCIPGTYKYLININNTIRESNLKLV